MLPLMSVCEGYHIVTLVWYRSQFCQSLSYKCFPLSYRIHSPAFPMLRAALAWAKLGNGNESWKTVVPFYLLQSGHPADAWWRGHREEKKRFPCLNMGWMETASSNCSLLTVALFCRRVFPRSPPPPPPADTKEFFIFLARLAPTWWIIPGDSMAVIPARLLILQQDR